MIYYITIIILFFFSFYLQFKPKIKEIKKLSIISFFGILIIGGLRDKVGADWYSYQSLFNATKTFHDLFSAREEKLFMAFIFISSNIVKNYSFFIFFFFAFSFSLKYYIFSRYSPDIFLSLIIYFFTIFLIYDLNGIRQGMAIGFVLLSISSILNKQLLLFIILITIASLFHISAIIILPFYWLSRINISEKKIIILTILSLIMSIPIRIFIENSQIFQSLLAIDSFSHYSTYIDNKTTGRNISILSIAVFQRVFILSLFLINFEKIKADDNLKQLLINGYFIALIIFIFFSFSAEFSSRLSFYYKSFEMIMVPFIVISQKRITNKVFLLIIFLLLSLIGTYRILDIPNGGLLPYNSILW